MIRPSASPLSALCRDSLRIIVIMCTASHSVVCQPDGLYSVFVSPTSLRPLSCPALGPRVIDRPRDSGFGGCCAASLLLLQRNRVAPLITVSFPRLSAGSNFSAEEKHLTFRALYRPPAGRLYFPRESFFCHADPRIGDGYRKLSLTPTGVPNES